MKNKIKTNLKRYIRLNLEDRISQILCNNDKVRILSKRDLISIIKFMKEKQIYSKTILQYAYTNSVHIYCSKPSLPDLNNRFLMDIVDKGNIDIAKYLLSQEIMELFPSIDPSSNNNYVIISACLNGHLDFVKFLLSNEILSLYPRIDPSANDNYAVISTFVSGKLEVVKYLLSAEVVRLFPNIDPSANSNQAIILASRCGHLDVVKFLLSSEVMELYPKIDPKTLNNKPIELAHQYGHTELVEFLRIHVYNSAPLSDILQNKI